MKDKIVAKDPGHLVDLIEAETKLNGFECDVNHIDVSQIIDMSYLFISSKFNGDISKWDVSKVRDMTGMFYNSEFSHDLSEWKPYNLVKSDEIFVDSKAPVPYWAKIENCEERRIAIEKYELSKKLEEDLNIGSSSKKKLKL